MSKQGYRNSVTGRYPHSGFHNGDGKPLEPSPGKERISEAEIQETVDYYLNFPEELRTIEARQVIQLQSDLSSIKAELVKCLLHLKKQLWQLQVCPWKKECKELEESIKKFEEVK